MADTATPAPGTIPVERWGLDHLRLLTYVEDRNVNYGGRVDRLKFDREYVFRGTPTPATVLADHTVVEGYSVIEQMDDLVAAGLVEPMGRSKVATLTRLGWDMAHVVRRDFARTSAKGLKGVGTTAVLAAAYAKAVA